MKELSRIISIYFISCALNSCNAPDFSRKEISLTLPYLNEMLMIYETETGLRDTLLFSKSDVYIHSYNNFEQGFYKERVLKVYYSLSNGSYHKQLNVLPEEKGEVFVLYTKSSSHITKQLNFLGMLFDTEYLDSLSDSDSCYIFNQKEAIHNGININKKITSFKYCIKTGVTSYSDESGLEWTKIN